MALIYRAVWEDLDHEPIAVLEDAFKSWTAWKGVPGIEIPVRGSFEWNGSEGDVRRGDAEFGRILRVSLREVDPRLREWTTTATALSDKETNCYWVDVDCVDPNQGRVEVAAPRLVREILSESGSPRRGPVKISADRQVVLHASDAAEVIDLLFSPLRDLPVVIFSPDVRQTPEINDRRARSAATTLAGLASVHLLGPNAIAAFNNALPKGFQVYGGAARLYFPAIDVDDAEDSARHRWYPTRTFVQDPRRAGMLIAHRLATARRWVDPPSQWEQLRSLVTRPSEEQLAIRRAEIVETLDGGEDEVERLRAERGQLLELLVVAESERDTVISELTVERNRLRAQIDAVQESSLDDAVALEELVRERDELRRTIRLVSEGTSNALTDTFETVDIPLSPSEAIEVAREHLARVVIPAEALQEVDSLDESLKDRIWASTTWQGLVALEQYARAVEAGESHGSFYLWCQESGAWPTSKLSMVESESVRNEERLRRCRMLPVSRDVDPRGELFMEAHLKIQNGGGPTIPRLYFHDDTRGTTGKIHIGFYGPHSLMPNTRTN